MTSPEGKSALSSPLLYKLVQEAIWEEAQKEAFWAGSPDDLRDGFIHLSTRGQLEGTLRAHLAGESSVLVLGVDVSGPDLHWEPSRNGLLFPHWYAPLPRASIRLIKPIPLKDGIHQVPPLPESPGPA